MFVLLYKMRVRVQYHLFEFVLLLVLLVIVVSPAVFFDRLLTLLWPSPPHICLNFSLGKSLKRFMASTTLYLNAFVARRQQVLAVQEQHAGHLVGEIETTPAFDFVKLVAAVDGDDGELLTSVRLVYEDLTSQLPSRVVVKEVEKHAADDDNDDDGEAGPIHPPSVSALDTPSAIRNRAVEKQFRTTPLHEALDEYL